MCFSIVNITTWNSAESILTSNVLRESSQEFISMIPKYSSNGCNAWQADGRVICIHFNPTSSRRLSKNFDDLIWISGFSSNTTKSAIWEDICPLQGSLKIKNVPCNVLISVTSTMMLSSTLAALETLFWNLILFLFINKTLFIMIHQTR